MLPGLGERAKGTGTEKQREHRQESEGPGRGAWRGWRAGGRQGDLLKKSAGRHRVKAGKAFGAGGQDPRALPSHLRVEKTPPRHKRTKCVCGSNSEAIHLVPRSECGGDFSQVTKLLGETTQDVSFLPTSPPSPGDACIFIFAERAFNTLCFPKMLISPAHLESLPPL